MTKEQTLNLLREVPVFGGLVDCGLRDHWESLSQTTVLIILSAMPFWLGALIIYSLTDKTGSAGMYAAFYSTMQRGELFMYSTALLAPVFWIALADYPGARVFPGKVSHIVIMVIISVIAAVFFGLQLAGDKTNEVFTFKLSVLVCVFSLVLLYLGVLYHENRLRPTSTILKKQEQEFSDKYSEHRNA